MYSCFFGEAISGAHTYKRSLSLRVSSRHSCKFSFGPRRATQFSSRLLARMSRRNRAYVFLQMPTPVHTISSTFGLPSGRTRKFSFGRVEGAKIDACSFRQACLVVPLSLWLANPRPTYTNSPCCLLRSRHTFTFGFGLCLHTRVHPHWKRARYKCHVCTCATNEGTRVRTWISSHARKKRRTLAYFASIQMCVFDNLTGYSAICLPMFCPKVFRESVVPPRLCSSCVFAVITIY
jgi:hypothetical protein